MLDQELKNIWSNTPMTEEISINTNQLMNELNQKMIQINKNIKNRDLREYFGVVVGIITFGYVFFVVPLVILKVCCILFVLWFGLVVYKINKAKQHKEVSLTSSINEQLNEQKNILQAQVKLLKSVPYWYVLPPFLICVVFILGIDIPPDQGWDTIKVFDFITVLSLIKLVAIILFVFFFSFIIWINKRAVKKELNPILENIERIENSINQE